MLVTWRETPYWQDFCGETYLQTELPIDASSLTRWRKRIGEEGVEVLLAATIEAARAAGLIKKSSLDKVIVDTTVMPKAIAYPTDSRLRKKRRQHLVKLAGEHGLELRQNYNRQAPCMAAQIGRYAHAKQYKRMRKAVKAIKTRVGRVHRKVQRKLEQLPDSVSPRRKTCCTGSDASSLSRPRTATNCMRCIHRRWSAFRKARPERPMNSA